MWRARHYHVNTLVMTQSESPSPNASDSLPIGAFAGPWRIEYELGRGGMGVVYAVEHAHIGKRAALKVLHRRIPNPERHAQRMLLEARVVNAIGHPNIIDVFDVGSTLDGRPYIVMERLEGRSLAECDLDRSASLHVLREVCVALEAAHAAGVVHRDLKPDNIFIGIPDGRVTLLDWGIARVLCDEVHATLEGQLVGTPQYISPEQARGDDVTPKTDVYALGVLAYELLVGEPPFTAKTVAEVMAQHLYASPRPPREIEPSLPAHLESLLLAMLAKNPADRPAIHELIGFLVERLPVARAPVVVEPPDEPVAEVERPASRRWMAVTGVLALAASAAVFMIAPRRRVLKVKPTIKTQPITRAPASPAPPLALSNPVLDDCADPSVLRDGSRWYMTCTAARSGNLFPIYESADLQRWKPAGWIFPAGTRPAWATGNYWAPELHRDGDHIAAYFSMRVAGGHNAVGVATAASIVGPYQDRGAPLIAPPHGASDAHMFATGGKQYVYFKREGNPSSLWALADGATVPVLAASEPWEHGNVEAPWVTEHAGYFYLFYSGSRYCDSDYGIGVARGKTPLGPFEKLPAPLVKSTADWTAPGHNTIFDGPSGEPLIAYHAYRASEGAPSCETTDGNRRRHVRIERIAYVDGWPRVDLR